MQTTLQSQSSPQIQTAPKSRIQTPNEFEPAAPQSGSSQAHWPSIIMAVRNHLSLYTVIALVIGAAIAAVAVFNSSAISTALISGFAVLALIVVAVVMTTLARKGRVAEEKSEIRIKQLLEEHRDTVMEADAPPLSPDGLTRELMQLRSVVHQAARYTTPIYYLDSCLNLIDWNIAFELLFERILPKIRGKHVNHFIAELENCEAVFDHARDFTTKVEQGELPLIDMEPLIYRSEAYGTVRLEKLACQLTDADAKLRAWAVSLLPREMDWKRFGEDLLSRLHEDKRWSIYAVSYDAILLKFPGYRQLIEEIIHGVPRKAVHVLDLGAGTGNVTRALLNRGYRVTAVENNQAMIEKLTQKNLDPSGARLILNKQSAADLGSFADGSFDAVVACNVLYALDDPLGCIREVARILKPGGAFAFSTTTAETELDPLLNEIQESLKAEGHFEANRDHYQRVYDLNKDIEIKIARRHSRKEYEGWLEGCGFRILTLNPDAYSGAVTVIHARKA